MEPSDKRLRDWTDRTNLGTHTIVTSGSNASMTGASILTQDYTLHSYLAWQVGAGPHSGAFIIDVSNDNLNFITIAQYDITPSGVGYADTWGFAYGRPSITGTAGDFVINERHIA